MLAALTACSGKPRNSDGSSRTLAPEEERLLTEKMHELSTTLSTILPIVNSAEKFNNKENAEAITAGTERLRALAHGLSRRSDLSDPSALAVGELFDETILRAQNAFRSGQRDYARQILKDTTSYCIQCHTEVQRGAVLPRLEFNVDLRRFSLLEKADFYTATRQFDLALDAYIDALKNDRSLRENTFKWQNAARTAMALTIKVKDSPSEAQALMKELASNKKNHELIRSWDAAIARWRSEVKLSLPNAAKLDKADRLLSQANKNMRFELDHSQDVLFFRASRLAHQVLAVKDVDPSLRARALYIAGITSEATRDLNFFTLHETLYEQCIRTSPHTLIANKCFIRLSDSITMGYTGSSGTDVPAEFASRLENLKPLASPTARGTAAPGTAAPGTAKSTPAAKPN